jgi:tetrapyrrole methylase family protein/MazG family protein
VPPAGDPRVDRPVARPVHSAAMSDFPAGSPPAPDRESFADAAARLLDLVRHLAGPDGCPWDREQTPRTISPYLVEEAHEIGEAIVHEDAAAVREELGDLFFLSVFLAVALEREGGRPPAEALTENIGKMIRRHPHVFHEPRELDSQGVLRRWEERKQKEGGHESVLGKSPKALPALLQAYRAQEKAASVGFDWDSVDGVIAKLREEVEEAAEAITGGDATRISEELGDLLFAVVNLARFVKSDPEAHLRAATGKFRRRFDRVVAKLRAEGRSVEEAGLPELDRLWEAVKEEERD